MELGEPTRRDEGTAFDEGELARLSASTPERIRQLVRIGVIHPDAQGRFAPADIQRVQIVAAFEAGGIELEHIAGAISERRMSFDYTDGIYPEASPPSGRFADMSGFTRLTEEHGDEAAVRFAAGLSREATYVAADHGGRLVKRLGDGVMLAFQHVGHGIGAAFGLRASAARAGLPPLHIGITAGPMVERDGDYFGRTVNLASRLSGVAGPGEIVADEPTASAAHDVQVTALGPRELKGLLQPIAVFRLDDGSIAGPFGTIGDGHRP